MKPLKIVFLGLFGQGNLGNDCTLQAMIYHTRRYYPDAELRCICPGPEEISSMHNISVFPIGAMLDGVPPEKRKNLLGLLRKVFVRISRELLHVFRAIRTLKGSDILIAPGTGLLVDHTTGFRGFPYYVFKWTLIAKLCRCKSFIVSMGAGPLYHPLSRRFIKYALRLMDYRSFRDAFSKQYIENIGFKTNSDGVYPDLAFSLPEAMMPVSKTSGGQRPVIGVGVVDYYGPSDKSKHRGETVYRDYIGKTAEFVKWLLEHNYTVQVLIGDIKYDSRVRQDLIELLESQGLKNEEDRVVNEPVSSVEQLLAQLAETHIVISPRFHNIILALMLNKPVISLSHDKKFDSLMAGLGLAEYCLNIEGLNVGRLIERFVKLEKNTVALKPYIKQKTEEYRRALDEQYKIIFNLRET